MYEYWLINCNKHKTLMLDVNNETGAGRDNVGTLYFLLIFP